MFNEFIAIIIGWVRGIVAISGVFFFIVFLHFMGRIIESTVEFLEMLFGIGFAVVGILVVSTVCYLIFKYLGKIQDYFWEK